MTTHSFKPSKTSTVAYTDAEIIVYADGTWEPAPGAPSGPWQAAHDAQIYAGGSRDTHITAKTGRSKVSRVITPTGRTLDVRALAMGSTPPA